MITAFCATTALLFAATAVDCAVKNKAWDAIFALAMAFGQAAVAAAVNRS